MIPKPYRQMHQLYPEMMRAYEAFGDAARQAGPLSSREATLVKLAISIGAGLEGAAHSHCRKALEAGCTAEDLRHVAVLAAPTIGFPTMMRARSWVEDVLAKQPDDAGQHARRDDRSPLSGRAPERETPPREGEPSGGAGDPQPQ